MSFLVRLAAVQASAVELRHLGDGAADARAYARAHLELQRGSGGLMFGLVAGSLHGFAEAAADTLEHLQTALVGSAATLDASVDTYRSADELTRRRLSALTSGGHR